MSASLVGSEMCIRDRSLRRRCCERACCQSPRRRACLHRRLLAWPCSSTVSYTHLTLPTICSV
eukprot:10153293-Alexandrium_andersonii.AAC.1